MPVWLSRLVLLIDWALSLIVDELFADLSQAQAEARGRETVRKAEERRLVADQERAVSESAAAKTAAERARAETERAQTVTPTPAGEESAAAAEFDDLTG